MLSIKKMGRGSENYYLNLTDYFLKGRKKRGRFRPGDDEDDDVDSPPGEAGFAADLDDLPGEPAGEWVGRGCRALGLFGVVLPEELKPLMLGFHPGTGAALVQNPGAPNRVPGWDLTFSAPKSVSIVWSQADEKVRRLIENAQRQSVHAAIDLAERELAFSRTGKGGTSWVQAQLVVAAFEHGTSRNEDPQLHTHCLVLNVGVDQHGKTRALFSKSLYVNRDLLGAYYRAHLSQRLRTMGFRLRKHGRSFEIVNVPERLITATSSRRGEIVAQLDRQGRRGGVAAAVATLDTRKTKAELPPRSELFARWQDYNRLYGLTDVSDLMDPTRPQRQGTFQQAIDAAIARLTEEHSHFSKTALLAAALQEAPALGLPPDGLLEAARAAVHEATALHVVTTSFVGSGDQGAKALVNLGSHDGQQRFTTREVLEEEEELLQSVEQLRTGEGANVPEPILQLAVDDQMAHLASRAQKRSRGKRTVRPTPSEEQLAAARHMTQGEGRLRIVTGVAGSGKTDFPIAMATRAWEEAGYQVHVATPTAKAARVLQRATGQDAQTVTKTLGDYELPWSCVLKHHLEQLKRAALGRRTNKVHKPRPIALDANSVLLVDEASMLSTRHMSMLLAQAQKSGATLVLVGDQNQLPPVGRGAPFTSIAMRVGSAQLNENRRQEEAWARKVAELAAAGEVRQALQALSERELIKTSDSVSEAMEATVAHWASLGAARQPGQAIILASTNDQCEALNQLAQQHRLAAGILNPKQSLLIRDVQEDGNAYESRVHQGDLILVTRNSRAVNIDNGDVGTVTGVNTLTKNLVVQFPDGRTTIISAKNFQHLRLGYAVTPYKAQGDTYQHALLFVTESEQSQLSFNVQVTRAKESTTIFTTRGLWNPGRQPIHQSPLADILSRQPDLRLAWDLLERDSQRMGIVPQLSPPLELGPTKPILPPVVESGVIDGGNGTFMVLPSRLPIPQASPHSPAPAVERQRPPANPNQPEAASAEASREAQAIKAPDASAVSPNKHRESPRPRRYPEQPAASTEPLALPPMSPTPAKKKKKRKKRRGEAAAPPAVETTDLPLAQAIEDPIPPQADLDDVPGTELAATDSILPEDFFAVPLPAVGTWRPRPANASAERIPLLPEDFMSVPKSPLPRKLALRLRNPEGFKKLVEHGPQPAAPQEIPSREMANNPRYSESLANQQVQELYSVLERDYGVPRDQIDIINVRHWQEEVGEMIRFWVEITYRIRTYGPQDLTAAVAIPFDL